MNLQQAKIILEKINRLYQSMTLDAANIDVFEQDLMLSYVVQLHDAFSTDEQKKLKKRTTRRPKPQIPEVYKAEPPSPPPAPPKPEPVAVKKAPAPVAQPEPVAPQASAPVSPPAPEPVQKPTPPPAPVPTPEVKKPTPPPPAPPKPQINPDHDVLFEQKEARELSEKLSSQPIGDLNRAMGINERFLTINELFDRDNQAYQNAINKLNGLNSFEEAKSVLSELAEKHDWTKRGKKKKAQVFIKLVRRRYL